MKKMIFSMAVLLSACVFSTKTFAQAVPGGSADGGGVIDGGGTTSTTPQPLGVHFMRNNGDGTCGGNAQIRLYYNTAPTIAPTLDNIIYNGSPLIANFVPKGSILADLTTKGYLSFCMPVSNIPPAIKLTLEYHYQGTTQSAELSGTN
ncbi:MAG: hypothetical protein M3004_13735 [Bacteroidota bacterium]|nr:hypothetical protein [Bacteroidota bacterium]